VTPEAPLSDGAKPNYKIMAQRYQDTEVREQIARFFNETLLYVDEGISYTDDSSFINEGLIDSMGVMELVEFVQHTFGIEIDPLDITMENFDSINKITAFVRRKQMELMALEQPA
jgi:acyl carrier protein